MSFAFFEIFAFVLFFPAASEAELDFNHIPFQVGLNWNQREAFFVKPAGKFGYFALMKKKPARAAGFVIGGGVFGLISRNFGV